MTITAENFNAVMDEWKEWQTLPWGRLFYSLSQRNLEGHLSSRPLRILDVGGGNGMNSVYFAGQGHHVVLLDYSSAMLADAQNRAKEQGVIDQITFIEANVQRIADEQFIQDVLHGEQFDLILCNLMIEFLPDPLAFLKILPQRLTAGGLLSLIDGNRYCEAFRLALFQNDLNAALHAVGSTQYPHRWFNRPVPIYAAEEIIHHLQDQGCELAGQYGIWCVTQYLPNDRKYEPEYYAELEQLEYRLGSTYPYYLLARFFQIVMKKP